MKSSIRSSLPLYDWPEGSVTVDGDGRSGRCRFGCADQRRPRGIRNLSCRGDRVIFCANAFQIAGGVARAALSGAVEVRLACLRIASNNVENLIIAAQRLPL